MTEEQFGSCPECGKTDGYRNIYKQHFFYCDEHRLVWLAGSNLFSSWRDEDEDDWRTAWEYLKGYRTVDGFGEYEPGPPLGEQAALAEMLPTPDPGEGAVAELEEELRQLSTTAEQEQLEREISGNLTPDDEKMIDLREERLLQEAYKQELPKKLYALGEESGLLLFYGDATVSDDRSVIERIGKNTYGSKWVVTEAPLDEMRDLVRQSGTKKVSVESNTLSDGARSALEEYLLYL